jgi:hypothetical protein
MTPELVVRPERTEGGLLVRSEELSLQLFR